MKKRLLLIVFVATGIIAISQTQDVMTVKLKNGDVHEFNVEDVSEVTFQQKENSYTPEVYLTCPDDHHPHIIDLGLPSGTKWACCNVGATVPEGYGGYYAWGETETKPYYDWTTYAYVSYSGGKYNCFHIGDDIAGTEYDVAYMKWGNWCMPSYEQMKEILDNCSKTLTTQNGINGILVTGPSGGTIFFPSTGMKFKNGKGNVEQGGSYWTSTLYQNDENLAYQLFFLYNEWYMEYNYSRDIGCSVRAIYHTPQNRSMPR